MHNRFGCIHLIAVALLSALIGGAAALVGVWVGVLPVATPSLPGVPPVTRPGETPTPPQPSAPTATESAASEAATQVGLRPAEQRITCFRGNPERSRSGVGPVPRHPKLLWRFRTQTKIEGPYERRGDKAVQAGTAWYGTGWTGQPCIYDGRVYFGSTDSYVYCLDLKTGREIWHYGNHHSIKGSISLLGGRIYHGGRDNKIHCYTLDGKMVWETRIGEDTDSNPILARGRLFIGGEDNSIYCLNPDTGTIVWRYGPTEWSCESSPCYAENSIIIGSSGGMLYCLNAQTGTPMWILPTGGDGDPTPVYMRGCVYHSVHTRNTSPGRGKVRCVDVGLGKVMWAKDLPRGVWATAGVNPLLRRVYIGCADGVLYCLKSGTGETVWERKLGLRIWSSPVVVDGTILVGVRDNGSLWCLNEEDGKPLWVFEGTDIDSTPAVADGMIVIGDQDGWVYAIGEDPDAGPPDPRWFRAGPAFSQRADRNAAGIPTWQSSAPTPKAYTDTSAGSTDHLRVPVHGPAYGRSPRLPWPLWPGY